jgi:hypothetical protein
MASMCDKLIRFHPRRSEDIARFLQAFKNAGVLLNGEYAIRQMLENSDRPARTLVRVAEQGRTMGMEFYERAGGANIHQAWQAFKLLGDPDCRDHFMCFEANLVKQLRTSKIPDAFEC